MSSIGCISIKGLVGAHAAVRSVDFLYLPLTSTATALGEWLLIPENATMQGKDR